MTELGTAYISIVPDTKKFAEELKKALQDMMKGDATKITPKVDADAVKKDVNNAIEKVNKGGDAPVIKPKIEVETSKVNSEMEKAGKQAGETFDKSIRATVKSKSTGEIIGEELGKGLGEGVVAELKSTGIEQKLKTVFDALPPSLQGSLEQVGKNMADGIKDGFDPRNLGEALRGDFKGPLEDMKGTVKNWAKSVADQVRGGDIQGALSEVGTAVEGTSRVIAKIGEAFGLKTGGIQEFGQGFAGFVDRVNNDAASITGTLEGFVNEASGLSSTLSGLVGGSGKLAKFSEGLAFLGGPEVAAGIAAIAAGAEGSRLLADTIYDWANADKVKKVRDAADALKRYNDVIQPLAETQIAINDNQLVVKAPTKDQIQALQDAGLALTQIEGTHEFVVEAKTEEAATAVKKFVETNFPNIKVNVEVPKESIDDANQSVHNFTDKERKINIGIKLDAPPGDMINNIPGVVNGKWTGPPLIIPGIVQLPPGLTDTPRNAPPIVPAPGEMKVPGLIGPDTGGLTYDPSKNNFNRQTGGGIPGSGRGDIVPVMAEPGEHMLTRADVTALGGQGGVYAFRRALHMQGGGEVDPNDPRVRAIDAAYRLRGKPYQWGTFDCSEYMSEVYSAMAGLPAGRKFNTESGPAVFEQLGFKRGFKPGALNIGMTHGGPGGGHVAGTLPNGVNIENGPAGMSIYGPGAAGAQDFADQWYYEPPGGSRPSGPAGPAPGPGGPAGNLSNVHRGTGEQPGPSPQQVAGVVNDGVAQGLGDSAGGRTEGFIPAAQVANVGTVSGTSFLAGILNLGNEAVAGGIDIAADAAKQGINAGISAAIAAGGAAGGGGGAAAGPASSQATGALANWAVGLAATEAKRVSSYGFQLAAIWSDAAIEQLFPFGAPRWLGYDYTQFLPQLDVKGLATSTLEKAFQQGQQGDLEGQKEGTPAGSADVGQQPGGPVSPETLPGAQPQQGPVPAFGQKPSVPGPPSAGEVTGGTAGGPQPFTPGPPPGPGNQGAPPPQQTDPTQPFDLIANILGYRGGGAIYDQGGILPPQAVAVNRSRRPEAILTQDQWDAMGEMGPLASNYGVYINQLTAVDAEDVGRQISNRQRLAMMQYSGRP
jgi:hypothetical protein